MEPDQNAGEILWDHIERCKTANGLSELKTAASHARNGHDPEGLSSLANSVFAILDIDDLYLPDASPGREHLLKAIQTEENRVQLIPKAAHGNPTYPPRFAWNRMTLLVAMLLLLAIVAGGLAIWKGSEQRISIVNAASSCATPAVKSPSTVKPRKNSPK